MRARGTSCSYATRRSGRFLSTCAPLELDRRSGARGRGHPHARQLRRLPVRCQSQRLARVLEWTRRRKLSSLRSCSVDRSGRATELPHEADDYSVAPVLTGWEPARRHRGIASIRCMDSGLGSPRSHATHLRRRQGDGAVWSPDGERIAFGFASRRRPMRSIGPRRRRPATSRSCSTAGRPTKCRPAFSPDGKTLLYTRISVHGGSRHLGGHVGGRTGSVRANSLQRALCEVLPGRPLGRLRLRPLRP